SNPVDAPFTFFDENEATPFTHTRRPTHTPLRRRSHSRNTPLLPLPASVPTSLPAFPHQNSASPAAHPTYTPSRTPDTSPPSIPPSGNRISDTAHSPCHRSNSSPAARARCDRSASPT